MKGCVAELKNNEAAGASGIVKVFLKNGAQGIIDMAIILYDRIWGN